MAVGSTNGRIDHYPHVNAAEAYLGHGGLLYLKLGDAFSDEPREVGNTVVEVITGDVAFLRHLALTALDAADQMERTERSVRETMRRLAR